MKSGLEDKLSIYEQLYFGEDEPVPFIADLKIYPARLKDYYKFYSLISCFTIDKNADKTGIGIPMSDLGYLVYLMQQPGNENLQNQLFELLGMVFHLENGLYCDNEECEHKDIISFKNLQTTINQEMKKIYQEAQKETAENNQQFVLNKKQELFTTLEKCPICGKVMRDVFELSQDEKKQHKLYIKGIEVNSKNFKDLKRIYCYQNILDYNDDYIDPELKEALAEAAKLRAGNTEQPTLERQKACIVASTGYKFDELGQLTLRKFSLLVRIIVAKVDYTACKTGEMSGMGTFKSPYPHWVYANDDPRKNRFKDIMSVDQIEKKIGGGSKIV